MPKQTDRIRETLAEKTPRKKPIPDDAWLSLGCTVMNMHVSGRPDGGIAKGMYAWFCGASSSGKTWWLKQVLAEAANNPQFKDYRLIFDNAENGSLMDDAKYFGEKMASRIEPPNGTKKNPKNSAFIEEFYYNVDSAFKEGTPFVYALDSMDALLAKDDESKFQEEKTAFENDKVPDAGSYGMAKAKINSKNIKRVVSKLARNGSILLVVSQTRDKIGGMVPNTQTTSGGKALRFFAHVQIWTSIKEALSRDVMGKRREYGKRIVVDVDKNRVSGWEGKFTAPFLRKHGFDEVGGNIDYLVEEKHWKKADKGGTISAPEFDFKGTKEKLVDKIQSNRGYGKRLSDLVAIVWRRIDEATTIKRTPRYE